MSEPYITTIFSNQWERLADALAERLFTHTLPFDKRYAIVPNEQTKEFLHFHLAARFGISAGVQICSLSQALAELCASTSSNSKKRIPCVLELSLCIEEQIHWCLASDENRRIPIFIPLYEYLFCEKKERLAKRIFSLSDQLAHIFIRYGLYGGSFVSEWLEKEGWQQWIWQRIFSKSVFSFDLMAKPVEKVHVHLFGFSHLPPLYLSFFANIHGTFYLFSPCAQYWDDLCSDKERLFLERLLRSRKISPVVCEEMEEYLQDHHPLLANWGKWEREFLKGLDSYLLDADERYTISPSTLLGSVKNSMLYCGNPTHEPIADHITLDPSIQIHSAPSKLREVEVLRDVIQTLLARHRADPTPLQPKDIFVLAPDIASYAPYIHMIFSSTPYAYRVQGLEQGSTSDFAQGFYHLISLLHKDISLSCIFKLFTFSPFRNHWGFSQEDVHLICSWLKRAQVRTGEQSWQNGIDRLLWGFAMSPDAPFDIIFPLGCIPQSDIEIFNRFLICYQALKKDIDDTRLSENKSLAQWVAWIRELAMRHFECDPDNEPLLCDLQAFAQQIASIKNPCFSFASMQRILLHFYEKRNAAILSEHLQHIHFSSMGHAAAPSARIVYLLGMDEESYPRFEAPNSLCALSTSAKKPYLPVKSDEDRHVFLELLCSASDYFIISYERVHPKDNKPQGSCYLIEQMRDFVKKGFSSPILEIDHPILSFDASYFSENAPVQNLNVTDFHLAKAHYSAKSEERDFFMRGDGKNNPIENRSLVRIASLRALAKHPIKFYFNQVLGMYVDENVCQEEDLFCLSPLNKWMLKRACLETDMHEVIAKSEAQGLLPEGMFKQAAIETLADEVKEQQRAFAMLNLETATLCSVELSPYCQEPVRLKEDHWILPALSVPLKEKELILCGKLSDFTHEGYLVHGKKDLETLIAAWPIYLIYLQIKDVLGVFPERILFSKEGTHLDMPLDNAWDLLKDYLAYFMQATQALSPLMPKWAPSLLLKNPDDFEKIVHSSLHKQTDFYTDPYLEWMKKAKVEIPAKEMFAMWSVDLKRLFEPLLREYIDE